MCVHLVLFRLDWFPLYLWKEAFLCWELWVILNRMWTLPPHPRIQIIRTLKIVFNSISMFIVCWRRSKCHLQNVAELHWKACIMHTDCTNTSLKLLPKTACPSFSTVKMLCFLLFHIGLDSWLDKRTKKKKHLMTCWFIERNAACQLSFSR